MELYLDLMSQPCRSVYIFAKMNNIPFEMKNIDLMNGEHYSEAFEKINQLRKVPALRDGDFCLAESIAIMIYMAQKFQTPDFWYPADLQQRARVHEYLSWQHLATRRNAAQILWLKLLIPTFYDIEVPQKKMDTAIEDLNTTMTLIEEKFIQDKAFITGDNISLADLVAIVEIMQPLGAGLDVFEGRPKLSTWRDRVVDAIGKDLFDDAHRKILGAEEAVKHMDKNKMQHFKDKVIRLFL